MSGDHSTSHIIQSLGINALIALSKGVAAFFTGSGAMLAEAIHSGADCANQILLLIGVKQGQKPADDKYPLGYGRNVYFWSFMVALMLFSGGGVFSIYEGIHKMHTPEAVDNVMVGIGILVFSIFLEGGATLSNIKELNKRKGNKTFFQYLKETKDSDLVVVFGENSAAVLGLFLALIALVMSYLTHDSRWDGLGSVMIGVVLVLVAIFLAVEIKSLLVGESADPEIKISATEIIKNFDEIDSVLRVISVQQGPGEVMIAMKLKFKSGISSEVLVKSINNFEKEIKKVKPEIKWCFIEPDVE